MATQKARVVPKVQERRGEEDSRGNVRIYTDIPRSVATEFSVMAIRRNMTKRALMARLITDAVGGK